MRKNKADLDLVAALDLAQVVTQAQTTQFFAEYLPHLGEIDPLLAQVGARLQEYCLRPGKAIRPLMVACGAAWSRSVPLAEALGDRQVQSLLLAVELIHKRLLMADDIADRDERRHGKPSFHTQWEQDLSQDPHYRRLPIEERRHFARSYTEIAGIWLQRLSEQAIAAGNFSLAQRRQIDAILLGYVYEKTPAGWYVLFDQNFTPLDQVSPAEFLHGLAMVTGAYSFQSPLLLGLLLGSAGAKFKQPLIEFGEAVGLVHQLTDDVIGLFGDPEVTGKPVGGDLREGKKTLLMQYAYQLGSETQRRQLVRLLGKPDITTAEVTTVRAMVESTGALAKNQAKIAEYVAAGEQVLGRLPAGEINHLLQQLLSFLVGRKR